MSILRRYTTLLATACGAALLAAAAGCMPAARTSAARTSGAAVNGNTSAVTGAADAISRGRETVIGDASRTGVLDEAERWLGTPYRYGAADRSGTDCSGFVCNVFRSVRRSLPRTSAEMATAGAPISPTDVRPGDLVFFNTSGAGVSHVGIIVTTDTFIHASTSKGVVVSRLDEPYYRSRLLFMRSVLP